MNASNAGGQTGDKGLLALRASPTTANNGQAGSQQHPSRNSAVDPETVYVQKLLEDRKLCLEVSVYRTPAKTGTIYYWNSQLSRRPRQKGPGEELWAIFQTSWKPIETDIAVKEAVCDMEPGIDLVVRMLPHPDLPHGFCWLSASSLGPAQRVDCAGYSVIYTVLEQPSGGRAIRVDSLAVSLDWIKMELKEEPRLGRLQWFKELGLVKD